ncbi:MAG: AmmeMemoRadiSam system radical SAM enzyme [Candidatus Erginobacter occultus]|nr:AmmeMemoRadiSam system radical SAM enzyme [Candidatus Erginobacter occultus]
MREALLYDRLDGEAVSCRLCAHRCRIPEGKRGLCGVRENRAGTLYSLVYGQVIALNADPIEKKPLFHFLPGTRALSVATAGCNFTCRHCQNADISQSPRENGTIPGREISPAELVRAARREGCRTIAYTYTEPTIFFEYALDTARRAAEEGIKNVFVTNGYMTGEALEMIAPVLDAANVDLKSFRDEFYREVCGAKLKPVLETIKKMPELGIWIEVTTLLIPGYNDSEEELGEIAGFLSGIDSGIPWHVSGFYPTYRLTDAPPTPAAALRKAREIGEAAGLRYVYTGNLPGDDGENTYCHSCRKKIVERTGYRLGEVNIRDGTCAYCSTPAAGVW